MLFRYVIHKLKWEEHMERINKEFSLLPLEKYFVRSFLILYNRCNFKQNFTPMNNPIFGANNAYSVY